MKEVKGSGSEKEGYGHASQAGEDCVSDLQQQQRKQQSEDEEVCCQCKIIWLSVQTPTD